MEEKEMIGLKGTAEADVTAENTARTMGSGSLEVFATPAMCCLMEKAASDLMDRLLDGGRTTVGISLQIAHSAPTPVGMHVRAEAEITAVDGRRISFRVTASDDSGEIGSGTHERFIVYRDRFQERADARLKG